MEIEIVDDNMVKSRIVVLFLAMGLILGTIPSALDATAKTAIFLRI